MPHRAKRKPKYHTVATPDDETVGKINIQGHGDSEYPNFTNIRDILSTKLNMMHPHHNNSAIFAEQKNVKE
jgi:hypothetical protein